MKVGIALIESYSFSLTPRLLGIDGIAAAARRLEGLGFDGIISSETAGHDPFFPLLIAAEHTERVGLATGVAVSFPRSPMVVAQMAWDLQRMSGGRFSLGLGTQVKGHNERRYGMPWTTAPAPRMRDYVECLRAIFATFQNPQEPTYFEGEHYKFTMAPPVFTAGPIEHPQPPIHLAAVNEHMSALAAELCDGVFAHPICTARYIAEAMLPALRSGARKAGRDFGESEHTGSERAVSERGGTELAGSEPGAHASNRPEPAEPGCNGRELAGFELIGAPVIVTGRNREELAAEKRLLKRRVAFYASTRSYHRVFEVHGWKELGMRLHALSVERRWDDMVKLIPDEMAEEFATVALLDEIGPKLAERWGGLLTTLNLPTDFPLDSAEDERRAAEIVATLQAA